MKLTPPKKNTLFYSTVAVVASIPFLILGWSFVAYLLVLFGFANLAIGNIFKGY